MRRQCRRPLVNFANPSGLLAEAARAAGWARSVGICDAPSTMQHLAAHLLDVPASEVYLDYFGLNHLGWVRRVLHHGKDFLPTFLSMIRAQELLTPSNRIPVRLGHDPQRIPDVLLPPTQLEERRSRDRRGWYLLELNAGLLGELHFACGGGLAGMLDRPGVRRAAKPGRSPCRSSRQAVSLPTGMESGRAAAMPRGFRQSKACEAGPRVLVINVPNRVRAGMAPDEVVEIPVLVTANALLPMAVGEIPGHCLGLMQQVKAYERLTIDAAVEGSLSKALTALTLHPLVADARKAQLVLDDFRRAHAATFPQLQ
jgi:6-phospho-beta-glucosidase